MNQKQETAVPEAKKSAVGHASSYTFATILSQVLNVLPAIASRRFVGPFHMGIWTILQVIQNYSKYTTLGTNVSVLREIPYYRGKGDEAKAEEVKNITFSFGMAAAFLTGAGIFIFALVARNRLSTEMFWGLLAVAVMVVLQRFYNLVVTLLRAYKDFDLASRQIIVSTVFNLFVISAATYLFKFYGLLIGTIVMFVVNIYYVRRRRKHEFTWILHKKGLFPLIGYGFPLMIMGVIDQLFHSIDKIMIAKMMGFQFLGFYSIATMAVNYVQVIPTSMAVIIVPYFHEKFGARDRIDDLKSHVQKSNRAFSHIAPFLIGGVWVFAPFAIQGLLPAYQEGIPAMLTLVMGTYFMAVQHPFVQFIMTIKKHKTLLPLSASMCVLVAVLNYFAITNGLGLWGIAMATTVCQACNFLFVFGYANRFIGGKESLGLLARILLKFVYLIGILILLERFMPYQTSGIPGVVAKAALFFIAYLPSLYVLNREFDLIAVFQTKFFGSKKNA